MMLHFIIALLLIISYMLVVWGIYVYVKNPSVVDVAWSLGIILLGYYHLLSADISPRIFLISHLLLLWGLRLAGYLWMSRVSKGEVDKRYTKLSEGWKMAKNMGFLLNFQIQGLLMFCIAMPLFSVSRQADIALNWFDWVAGLLICAGIIFEALADWQLAKFKNQPTGKVCNTGLWAYSRHPNYFAEWVIWIGFALYTLHDAYFLVSLLSPLVLLVIFLKITGPMTEESSIASRGEVYKAYQQQTPMFFPWTFK